MSLKPATLDARERSIVDSSDIGRLGTVSKNGWPHLVPVGYVFSKGAFYVASDKDAVKMKNIRRLPRATLVIDDEWKERGVMFECEAVVLAAGPAERWRKYMREVKGWKNDRSTAVIRLKPLRKASWFLKG